MLDTTLHKKDYIAYIYNTDALIQVGNVSFLQPSSQMRNFKLQEKQCVLVNLTFLGTMSLSRMHVPRIYNYPNQGIENTLIMTSIFKTNIVKAPLKHEYLQLIFLLVSNFRLNQ